MAGGICERCCDVTLCCTTCGSGNCCKWCACGSESVRAAKKRSVIPFFILGLSSSNTNVDKLIDTKIAEIKIGKEIQQTVIIKENKKITARLNINDWMDKTK